MLYKMIGKKYLLFLSALGQMAGSFFFFSVMAYVAHVASVDIKDIWFLFPYLEEKFTDKGVSTLMIKLYLDFNTWAEPLSQQARIRGSETSDFSAHLLIWVQTLGPACEMLGHLVFTALYLHSTATIFFQWSYWEVKWVNLS